MPFLRESACFPATCLLRDHFESKIDTIGDLVTVIETTEEKTSTAWFVRCLILTEKKRRENFLTVLDLPWVYKCLN